MRDGRKHKVPEWVNFLSVEGVIGAGKTTLCKMLAEHYNARLVLEQVEENPFLEKFYQNRSSFAFHTQLWFLLSRYKQLFENVIQQDLFHHLTISDYIFAKDHIFASINLSESEMFLYEQLANLLKDKIPNPDLVIYLRASTEVLLKRIERRSRSYEYNIEPEYIKILNESYDNFFFHYSKTPLIIINTDDLDFVNESIDFKEILNQIENAGKGTTYYNPPPKKERILLAFNNRDSVSDETTTEKGLSSEDNKNSFRNE
ncbi:MAG: deoxynucleoside kinase [Chitinispirillaceae bacterium]|nr:deoxynucleoside kinase [Chitinispirillaceae bacterium]